LERLEAGAAAARERGPAAVGLVWSTRESVVDPDTLQPGEYIAVDIRLEGCPHVAGEPVPDALSDPPCWWTLAERVTTDPQDLGVVRDGFGARVGRVMELEGSMISIEMDEAAEHGRA
jgi:hypothetical protein